MALLSTLYGFDRHINACKWPQDVRHWEFL
uniref:Uncharacterized protein n=1 Tax=Arundo donax TaxID=35708 RepID=A0A0A9CGT1_ARUDO